jgi:SulP family sulfate permease
MFSPVGVKTTAQRVRLVEVTGTSRREIDSGGSPENDRGVGGMPSTGVLARTAVNARSGARTRLAAAFHAVVLLSVVFLAGPAVGEIPIAPLAGEIDATGARALGDIIEDLQRRHITVLLKGRLRTTRGSCVRPVSSTVWPQRPFRSVDGVRRRSGLLSPTALGRGDEHLAKMR